MNKKLQKMWQAAQKFYRKYPLNLGESVMVAFLVTIYLSTALAIYASCALGLIWIFTKQYKYLLPVLKNNTTALWALILYLCFFVGLSYGDAPTNEALATIRKYRELLFIPLLSCFFTTERYRVWAWKAFIVASALTLIGSYLMDLSLLDTNRHKSFSLKSRITHSIFIAFFMFYCAHAAVANKPYRIWCLVALLLGAYNLFFVVEGRTGQLVFTLLLPLFATQRFGKKGLLVAVLGIVLFASLYIGFSDKSARVREGIANTSSYIKHTPEKQRTSMGQRYKLWEKSMAMIAEKPFFGHGTGSFSVEYKYFAGEKTFLVQNPHNEFLLIAVQFGVFGTVAYLGFLFSQYWQARVLPETERWLAQGLLLTLVLTSLFNSPFLDHTEGHWFAVMIALCLATNKPAVGPG